MTQSYSLELKVELLIAGLEAQKQVTEHNRREFESDLKRVKDDAEAEIQQVREKAEADSRANTAKIAALEDERNKALKWGVMTLGSAVIGMGLWIFDRLLGGHIK